MVECSFEFWPSWKKHADQQRIIFLQAPSNLEETGQEQAARRDVEGRSSVQVDGEEHGV